MGKAGSGRLGRVGEVWAETGGPERGRAEGWRKATCAPCPGAGLTVHLHTSPRPIASPFFLLMSLAHSLGALPLSLGLCAGAVEAPTRSLCSCSTLPRCLPCPRRHRLSPGTLESQTSFLGASNDLQEAFDQLRYLL